jgi:hypothetical protein
MYANAIKEHGLNMQALFRDVFEGDKYLATNYLKEA